MESNGHHAPSCSRCAGRFPRHYALNDIVPRALVSTGVPCVLEPSGLSRSDGKRPDGFFLFDLGAPVKGELPAAGRYMREQFGSVCTIVAPRGWEGLAAEIAALKKRDEYSAPASYVFVLLAVETTSCWCSEAKLFLEKLVVKDVLTPDLGYF